PLGNLGVLSHSVRPCGPSVSATRSAAVLPSSGSPRRPPMRDNGRARQPQRAQPRTMLDSGNLEARLQPVPTRLGTPNQRPAALAAPCSALVSECVINLPILFVARVALWRLVRLFFHTSAA